MRIWIWGCGKYGQEYMKYNNNDSIVGIIDNNDKIVGNYVGAGHRVYSFKEFEEKCDIKKDKLIICVRRCEDILEQIEKAGLSHIIYGYSKGGKVYADVLEFWGETIYSQLGEEIGVRHYFDAHFPADFRGTYVDVGCYHPYLFSNTAWAYSKGWNGCNIDANPKTIELFDKYRPNDRNVNCGIGSEKGAMDYYCMESDACNTFDIHHSEKSKVKGVYSMPIRKLDDVLIECGITKVDFLDIDVEGFDEEIILSFDWKRFTPTVVLVEIMMPIEKIIESSIHKKLTEEGYIFKNYFVATAMYIKSSK